MTRVEEIGGFLEPFASRWIGRSSLAEFIYKFLSTILFPCFESKMNSLQSIFEGVTFTNNDQVLQILQDEGVSLFVASLYT